MSKTASSLNRPGFILPLLLLSATAVCISVALPGAYRDYVGQREEQRISQEVTKEARYVATLPKSYLLYYAHVVFVPKPNHPGARDLLNKGRYEQHPAFLRDLVLNHGTKHSIPLGADMQVFARALEKQEPDYDVKVWYRGSCASDPFGVCTIKCGPNPEEPEKRVEVERFTLSRTGRDKFTGQRTSSGSGVNRQGTKYRLPAEHNYTYSYSLQTGVLNLTRGDSPPYDSGKSVSLVCLWENAEQAKQAVADYEKRVRTVATVDNPVQR